MLVQTRRCYVILDHLGLQIEPGPQQLFHQVDTVPPNLESAAFQRSFGPERCKHGMSTRLQSPFQYINIARPILLVDKEM